MEYVSYVGKKECPLHENSVEFELMIGSPFWFPKRELRCTGGGGHLIRIL